MIRVFIVVFLVMIFGLFLQATMVDSLFPMLSSPDLILLLVMALALRFANVWGLVTAFLLGICADFASAQFVGPHAAAYVLVFCLTMTASQGVYVERGVGMFVLSFMMSLVKSVVFLLMLVMFTDVSIFSVYVLKIVFIEALLTAIIAPIALKLISRGISCS